MPGTDPLAPADAFAVLGDETRIRILQELGDAWVESWPGVLPYATLMSRAGAEDSGRFHYHLDRLVGRFVVKREDGYKLDYTGLTVYRTLHAGTFTETSKRGPFDAAAACHACGSDLAATYSRDVFVVQCPNCGSRYCEAGVPPRAAERDREALLDAADRLTRSHVRQMVDGVCPWCTGGTHHDVLLAAEAELDPAELEVLVRHTCRRCGGRLWHPVGLHALVDPLVAATLADAGIDVRSRRFWEFAFAVTDDHVTVSDRDPWRFAVDLSVEGVAQTAVLGPDLRVTGID